MPDNQVPRFRTNANFEKNRAQSDAGFLGREVGEGDFGSEEAWADWEKGKGGDAGIFPIRLLPSKPEINTPSCRASRI